MIVAAVIRSATEEIIMTKPATSAFATMGLLLATALLPTMATAQATVEAKLEAAAPVADNAGESGTDDLNRQAAAAAAAQNAANANAAATYRQGVQDYEAARTQAARARADYEAAAAANRQARADYDAAYARWQADVAACNAGDTSRCGVAAPKS